MLTKTVLLGVFTAILVHGTALARQDLPVLRAESKVLDVQDGERLLKAEWSADPAIPLDVYDARRAGGAKRITFISDVDSMSFDVEPGRTYDFVILLGGKDPCRTRISTLTAPGRRLGSSPLTAPVTVPITISHGKLHVRGRVNGSEELDLIFDTGAGINALYPSAMARGAKLRLDGTLMNGGTGGTTVRRVDRDGRVEVGDFRWDHEPVMFIEKQVDDADGILGYPVFEDKVVEIDYDRMVMIVHEALPAHAAGFTRTPMPISGSLTPVEAVLVNDQRRTSGFFFLDTGGNGAMIVNRAFASEHNLRGTMKKLGTSESRGVGSAVIRSEMVLLPELRIAGFSIPNVPIQLEVEAESDADPPGGVLCMEVLWRFNTILDYPRNGAYFKPNGHFDAPFKGRSSGPSLAALAGVGAAVVTLLAAVALLRARFRATGAPPAPTPS